MSASDLDPERLSALIEGRLSPDERRRLLAEIEASPDARALFADVLAALPPESAAVSLGDRRWSAAPRTGTWIGLAAAAVLVIAVSATLMRRGRGELPEPGVLVASLALADSGAARILGEPVWRVARGATDPARVASARAVCLGATLATFEAQRERADTNSAITALDAAAQLESFPGGGIAASAWRALGDLNAIPTDRAVLSAISLAEQVVGQRPLRLGAMLQAARIAAATGDSAFLSRSTVRTIVGAATQVDASATSLAREFEQRAQQRSPDWPGVLIAVDNLLRHLGGE